MASNAFNLPARHVFQWAAYACCFVFGLTIGTRHADASFPAEPTEVASRHPVSVVEADIYVNKFRTIMRLKCFAEDLELLQGVEPLDTGFYDPEDLRGATEDHGDYLAEKVSILDKDGKRIEPRLIETIHIDFPEGEQIAAGKLMEYTIGFVFEYNYDQPQEFLTIQQDMVAEGQLLPSEFKMLLKQAGSDVPYVKMMKPTVPETIRFDWDNPVLNESDSDEDWEDWFDTQREKNLGITSYSSVYSFIYITDFEVRHEVLIPLATLATLIDIEREEENFLSIEEQDQASERIKEYFAIGNPVVIDGVEVAPVFDRVDFYGLDLRDFAMQAERRPVSMANGRVGLIMSYSTKGRPSEVDLSWDKFNDVIKTVDSVVFIGNEIKKTQFSMFLSDNTYHWSASDRPPLPEITGVEADVELPQIQLPIVSTGLAGVALLAGLLGLIGVGRKPLLILSGSCVALALMTIPIAKVAVSNPFQSAVYEMPPSDARETFALLHKNMFRAFDYHDESDVYDALEKSVHGDLLRKLYLDINQSLRIKEQGGAVARIEEVNLTDGNPIPFEPKVQQAGQGETVAGFGYRCNWNLVGTIEHWGHIHERTTGYEADFQVELIDGAWKITSMDVINEEQGVVKVDLRKF